MKVKIIKLIDRHPQLFLETFVHFNFISQHAAQPAACALPYQPANVIIEIKIVHETLCLLLSSTAQR